MSSFKCKGNYEKTISYLERLGGNLSEETLHKYGMAGKIALMEATPIKTGLTASSWSYEIINEGDKQTIVWNNTNFHNGLNIAIIIDNGYVTRKGYRVQGKKFIEKAIEPIYKSIQEDVFKGE